MIFFSKEGFEIVRHTLNTVDLRAGFLDTNCVELAHTILRPELQTAIRIRGIHFAKQTHEDQKADARRANKSLHSLSGDTLIISAEAFSFLRTPEEHMTFDIMFDGFDVQPIAFLREPHDWMESWKRQTANILGIVGRPDNRVNSIFNYDPNSWLLDNEALKKFFQPNGRFLSYEDELGKHGNVIPAFLMELGIPLDNCPPWQDIWANRSPQIFN